MEQYAHLELGTHHHVFNRGIAEANIRHRRHMNVRC